MLVDALAARGKSAHALRAAIEQGERLAITTIVLFEWLRGPRTAAELTTQEALFPAERAFAFGPAEAAVAARLYRKVPGARRREIDIAIAACALTADATLWTLNVADFRDIPGLSVATP